MKILVFGDTHGNLKVLDKIISSSKNVDLVICNGDLSNFGKNLKEAGEKLEKLDKLVLIIHGNHESKRDIDSISGKNIINLHKGAYELNDYIFFGYGGGGFAKVNKDFENVAKKFKKIIKKDSKVILITHGPPYKTVADLIPEFGHVGCKSIRKFIEEHKILINVCGHIHDTFGKASKIGRTLVVNPGPLGKIIEI